MADGEARTEAATVPPSANEDRYAPGGIEVSAHDLGCRCPECDPVWNVCDDDGDEDRARAAYERDHSAAVLG